MDFVPVELLLSLFYFSVVIKITTWGSLFPVWGTGSTENIFWLPFQFLQAWNGYLLGTDADPVMQLCRKLEKQVGISSNCCKRYARGVFCCLHLLPTILASCSNNYLGLGGKPLFYKCLLFEGSSVAVGTSDNKMINTSSLLNFFAYFLGFTWW